MVLTTSRSRAEEVRRRIEAVLAGLGLCLHPDKTRIVYLGGGEDGFDFLGFHHRKTASKWGDRRYLSTWPSTRAMASQGQGPGTHRPPLRQPRPAQRCR